MKISGAIIVSRTGIQYECTIVQSCGLIDKHRMKDVECSSQDHLCFCLYVLNDQ